MPDREELLRELERRDEEILRLRDLLLVKERELGQALGRLRELEDLSRSFMALAARVQARVPGTMRVVGAGLRRVQGRRGPDGG